MFKLWLGEYEETEGNLLVPQRLKADFDYFFAQGGFRGTTSNVLLVADLDQSSLAFLADLINVRRGLLKVSELPAGSFLHLWASYLVAVRQCNPTSLKCLRDILICSAPPILPRIPLILDWLLEWVKTLQVPYVKLALLEKTGLISRLENALSEGKKGHCARVRMCADTLARRTENDFQKTSWRQDVDSFQISLDNLYSITPERRVLSQCGLLLSFATREHGVSRFQIAVLCLHRAAELYLSLQLLRGDVARVGLDGKIRYLEATLVGEPAERRRESLLNAYYFGNKYGVLSHLPSDEDLIRRLNDLRNEATLVHGYSHPCDIEIGSLLSGVREFMFRLEGDNYFLRNVTAGFDRGLEVNDAFLWEIHPEVDHYYQEYIGDR